MKKKQYVNLPKGDTVPINPEVRKQVRKEEERQNPGKGASDNSRNSEPAVKAELNMRRRKK